MTIPGELASLLAMIGYDWPEGDEAKLFDLGQVWMDFATTVDEMGRKADELAAEVTGANRGEVVAAFNAYWSGGEGPGGVLAGNTTATTVLGAGYVVVAAVVLALKVQIIVQLIILAVQIAQAVATAVATFGASLLEIPIFKMITSLIVDQLIDMALQAILGG
ncbi:MULTISPECIES: WXG100-like domain-containing protein [unclassified Micromonospora]|uniref:WXG100-like domain-containing protein n=1 Tax=Micromonospora sp. NPDC005087 TaxID=3364225 RepID=UPI003679474B